MMCPWLPRTLSIIALASAVTWATELFGVSIVRGPYLQSASSTSMVVRWRTDVARDSFVRFHINGEGEVEVRRPELVTEHEVKLTGLSPASTYFYSVGFDNET